MIEEERKPFHEPMRLKGLISRRQPHTKHRKQYFRLKRVISITKRVYKENEAIITKIQNTTKNTNSKEKKLSTQTFQSYLLIPMSSVLPLKDRVDDLRNKIYFSVVYKKLIFINRHHHKEKRWKRNSKQNQKGSKHCHSNIWQIDFKLKLIRKIKKGSPF